MAQKTYQAGDQIYISSEGRMVYPGETFTVPADTPTGEKWLNEDGSPLAEKDKVGKQKAKSADIYSQLSLDDLKAIASHRKIPTTGKDADQLAEALRAAPAAG